ncbi:nucleoside 2-deoxyribosyltransferase domain-containing protein [Streptomyces sp. NPDC091265]|uniref:nucleoside 2-deoxyribosyltransferase domain-containing protein n=1 Tax=unclassified Streptomyces TaxID=2593676 RepID=UPI00344D1E25
MCYVEAPEEFAGAGVCLFLAGGISDCPDWQKTATAALDDLDVTVLNPRRSNFPLHDPNAEATQVGWEYRHLRRAHLAVFWFPESPTSHQPIALYELGARVGESGHVVVGTDPGYVRRTNVVAQLALARPELRVHTTLAGTIEASRAAIRAHDDRGLGPVGGHRRHVHRGRRTWSSARPRS